MLEVMFKVFSELVNVTAGDNFGVSGNEYFYHCATTFPKRRSLLGPETRAKNGTFRF